MKIYLVLTCTGTVLSKIIKYYTRSEFTHVSISLDKNLRRMYSFGRLNPYNPFYGGFVHERIRHGTFKRFKNTMAIIYSLEVDEQQYNTMMSIISIIKKNRRQYKFNIIGLFAVALHLRIQRRMSFYCAEFVKYILENAQVKTNLPNIIKPEDFRKIPNLQPIYTGKLNEYSSHKEFISNVMK